MTAELPDGYQGIPCYGHVDLGDGYALHRFYLDDDAYLQVSTWATTSRRSRASCSTKRVNPPTQGGVPRFRDGQRPPGRADDRLRRPPLASRVSDSTAGDARIPAMAYDEVLYRHDPPRRDDDLTHYAMLYAATCRNWSARSSCWSAAEDSGPNEFCVTYSVGVDLTTADIDIT